MTHQEQLNQVRAKIREATGVPEGSIVYGRPILLHDVLRAVHKTHGHVAYAYVRSDGMMGYLEQDDEYHNFRKGAVQWNLALSAEDQEPEVVEFLAKILGV